MTPADLDVSHHFVELAGLRLHYVEAGSGPTVVLLHGFPENWWSWRHQIMALAEAGLRVIAPDLRGYGETGKQGPYDLDTTANDVVQLIESLGAGESAHIVGHDWGGALAWHLAATRPSSVQKLAVLNCPHPTLMRQRLFSNPSQLKRSWYMFLFQVPLIAEWVLTANDGEQTIRALRGNAYDRTNFSDEELKPFREAVQKPGAASAMLGWYRAMIPFAINSIRRGDSAGRVEAETMLIWGTGDKALDFDVLVPGTEKYVPKLSIEKVEGVGHFVQSEAPDRVNALLTRFLVG